MTGHDLDHDNVLKELDAALQVEPSRAFADGVRARVTRTQHRTRTMWWGLAAAASIGLVTLAVWRPAVEAPVKVAVAPPPATASAVPAKAPESIAPEGAIGGRVFRPGNTARVARATSSEPRLEVITNQGAVLRALWADYRGRPLVIAEGAPVVDGPATTAIVVNPIVVPPIVVTEIGKEPGPAGATPIIRRADATRETK
jgi:hypothetical protein